MKHMKFCKPHKQGIQKINIKNRQVVVVLVKSVIKSVDYY